MKQFIVPVCLVLILAACNNAGDKPTTTGTAPAAAEVQLPYALPEPHKNWSIGSTENVATAMNVLKAFIDKDSAALAASIGDSMMLDLDQFQARLSRDSAMKFFTNARSKYTELNITIYDYISVISADKKTEWVTLWYKQTWKDTNGVADSINYVNDIRLENGKMVQLDEKGSRYMKK